MAKIFLTLLIFLFASLFFGSEVYAKDYYFPEVRAQYQINKDGSIDVKELRTYSFDGSFSWADIYIPLTVSRKDYNHKVSVTNFKILEDGKEIITVPDIKEGKFYALWNYNAYNEDKTFVISYRLNNAIGGGRNYDEFYWQVIGDSWVKRTEHAEFEVTFGPEIPRNQVYVFAHGPENGKFDFANDNKVKFTVDSIRPNQFIELRLVFPSGFVDSFKTSDKNLEQVFVEEKSIQGQTAFKALVKNLILWAVLTLTFLWFVYWVFAWFKYGREYKFETPKYLFDPPSDMPPALVEVLLSQNSVVSMRSFTATLFDLARRKYLVLLSRRYLKRVLVFTSSKYDYAIKFKVSEKEINADKKLLQFEKTFLRELLGVVSILPEDEAIGFGVKLTDHVVTFNDLKKHMKKRESYKFWLKWQKEVKDEGEKRGFLEQGSVRKNTYFWLSAILVIVLNVLVFFGTFGQLSEFGTFVGLFVNFIFFFVFFARILQIFIFAAKHKRQHFHFFGFMKRWNKTHGEQARKWQAFENFLEDMGHFREKLPHDLVLWEQYLVYGAVFGLTKKILELMPLAVGKQMPSWYVARGGTGGAGSFADFSNSIGSFSSSFSAGSGGSFSGGGGGGGAG